MILARASPFKGLKDTIFLDLLSVKETISTLRIYNYKGTDVENSFFEQNAIYQ